MRRCWSAWACSAAVACGAGCGAARTAPATAVPAAVWRANARQVVEQLRVDIAAVAIGGTTPEHARAALADVSDLYALLVAYSDLGGCRGMVAASAAPARVANAFAPACLHLQHAAALFARAAQHGDAQALVRATREAGRAQPFLVRAMLAIRRR